MNSKLGNYYLFDLVNTNNSFDSHSFNIKEKVENLRNILLDQFDWRSKGHIVFLPNAYYAKKILLNFFLSSKENIYFFSNDGRSNGYVLEMEEGLEVRYISEWNEVQKEMEGKKSVFWFSDVLKKSDIKRSLEGWNCENNRILVVETVRDDLYMNKVDAFIFNIMNGVTILGFSKDMRLKPVILGSNFASYADEYSYIEIDDYRKLESGTPNIPYLLEIESFYRNKIKSNRHEKKR